MSVQEGKLGVLGLTPGKIFHDYALQIDGKRQFFGEFALKEAQDYDWWCPFPEKFQKRDLM